MKKVIVKKLLTLTAAICLSFTSAYAFVPGAAIEAQAAGKITNPTPIQPTSNTDFSGPWNNLPNKNHDCYKVVLPADGAFTVTLMQQNAFGMHVNIRKAQTLDSSSYLIGTEVFCDYENSPRTGTVSTVLSAGTYFITVENNSGGINYGQTSEHQYKLKTVYESFGFTETPDRYDSPKPFVVGNTYTDALTMTDVEDWYKVTISENGKYNFTVSTSQNTVHVRLKDTDLNTVAARYCAKDKVETGDLFLNAGTYYLHAEGSPSKYTVSLDNVKIAETSITKVKAAKKKKVDVTFKDVKNVAGYQIRYSTDKNFEKNVKVKSFRFHKARTVGGNKRTYTISKLKKHKKYYFQIRTYVESNNERYYSDWSKSKIVKVK